MPNQLSSNNLSFRAKSRNLANADVKASSPIRTSLFEREGSMWGCLKRPSLRHTDQYFPWTFKAICSRLGFPVPKCLLPGSFYKPIETVIDHVSMADLARSDDSELCHEMLTKYGFTQEQMKHAAEQFKLGRSKSGMTIYWMIDDLGRCLDGRIGDTWVSTLLKARYPAAAPYVNIEHCFFGLHQISFTDGKSIGLVESERSAVLLSEVYPELTWLAYMYACNLTIDNFEPLQKRKITIYPRVDTCMDDYMAALEFSDQVKRAYKNIDISVSTFLEDHATGVQKTRHIDLADYLFGNS